MRKATILIATPHLGQSIGQPRRLSGSWAPSPWKGRVGVRPPQSGEEEISKSQLVADVYTNFITEEEFWKHCFDHKRKIERVAWVSEDAKGYIDLDEEDYIMINIPSVKRRMTSLYVEIKSKDVTSPKEAITKDDAKNIIHTPRVAVDRIIEIQEYWGHQIGTKGFLK